MKVTLRAFATPLGLGMAMVFFSGPASWSCDEGSCNNRPEQVQQEPVRTACQDACNNRPDAETSTPKPLITACNTNQC